MDFLDRISAFFNHHGKLIEIIAAIVTLSVIGYQTIQMNANIEEIKKSVVLDSHQAVHEHRQRINQILLNGDDQLSKQVFNLDKADIVGFTLITDYESLFNMHCNGLIPSDFWTDIEGIIYGTMKARPDSPTFMSEFWKKYYKNMNNDFSLYIKELISLEKIEGGLADQYCRSNEE